jgi:hypothetical protein
LAESNTISPANVQHLNAVLLGASDAQLVISSAWRYMVHGNAMTERGFEYMLRTHGVRCPGRVAGVTCTDELVKNRGRQIAVFFRTHYRSVVRDPFVILDDLPEGMTMRPFEDRLVKTDSAIGMTAETAVAALALLNTPCPLRL